MEAIGRLYRKQKAENLAQVEAVAMNELVKTLDVVTLEG
jgi:hypothetical protein